MKLDAHRQCFELFMNAFSTYRPLLTRIKSQYDQAIDSALKSEADNIQLRQQVVAVESSKLRAIEETRAEAAATAANQRGELARRLAEAESKVVKAEARAKAAVAEAADARTLAADALKEAAATRELNRTLKQRILDESSWGKRPLASQLNQVMVNPRTDGEQQVPTGGEQEEQETQQEREH
eukprot:CAMPEP_0196581856 /NCGR_PEP_ID=MMETSP1081-20130531/36026_1 /TAXON_ID=36882 /ORGANISM="Pyramimonas amylifera, Strain CCMP720" /LENGTH=181 /DNA_ID=CAMNT_0041902235 /DNA_START=41 /DNA_END=583 /DNA_ORIENTATION=-